MTTTSNSRSGSYTAEASRSAPYLASRCRKFTDAIAAIERYARFEAVVLLEGEPGTGKTFLARHLHAVSPRSSGVFHRVDLGTLDDSLAGSDLFGHVSGAFTGAQSRRVGHFVSAHGGTIFLDEIAKASKQVQQKLLHAIEYREVQPVGAERPIRIDVRIVAATNVALESKVASGDFLPDLLPRFGHFRVRIPALRERRADIRALAEYFVALHRARYGYDAAPMLDDDLVTAMERAEWLGNVRELDAAVQYMLVSAMGQSCLTLEHCAGSLEFLWSDGVAAVTRLSADVVRRAVDEAGSIAGAARKLRTARTTVYRYLADETAGVRVGA